uniref:Serine/threonine-protein phosphatase n=1 Tax=Palpitomonas bilix TaxID=652834 RepID=A0A7S3G6E4_9EUKA|mmetsp:Transcript_30463/g.78937  ORF Transcript_30463/g.78937 Transcript_30463/m.78937 type:complete len:524 (+) Transcript_30463:417-1988(+)
MAEMSEKEMPLTGRKSKFEEPPQGLEIDKKRALELAQKVTKLRVTSTSERIVTSVPPIPPPLNHKSAYKTLPDGREVPDAEKLLVHFTLEGRLEEETAVRIIQDVRECFKAEPNIVNVQPPVTVCGDVHGQFFDLVKLFDIGGPPKTTTYVFLGDLVDRGCFSMEVCLYLFSLKINRPDGCVIIRGNHECRRMTSYFNFKDESTYKYSEDLYNEVMKTFDCMPLCVNIGNKFLGIHGGISPAITSLSDIKKIDRFREPPFSGPMCDLIWADPFGNEEDFMSKQFEANKVRGCSYFYGYHAVSRFLDNTGFLSIIRAHEAQEQGYKLFPAHEKTKFPTVVTIFSAPNYCDVYNNKGAILLFQNDVFNIRQFHCSPHPFNLPDFMDVFSWSLPFVAEKVTEILYILTRLSSEEPEEQHVEVDEQGRAIVKNKVDSVGRFLRMYQTLRQEKEAIIQLKGIFGSKLPPGMLIEGGSQLKKKIDSFDKAKDFDAPNEHIPSVDEVGQRVMIVYLYVYVFVCIYVDGAR